MNLELIISISIPTKKDSEICFFYDDIEKKCRIHDNKPEICKIYPINLSFFSKDVQDINGDFCVNAYCKLIEKEAKKQNGRGLVKGEQYLFLNLEKIFELLMTNDMKYKYLPELKAQLLILKILYDNFYSSQEKTEKIKYSRILFPNLVNYLETLPYSLKISKILPNIKMWDSVSKKMTDKDFSKKMYAKKKDLMEKMGIEDDIEFHKTLSLYMKHLKSV